MAKITATANGDTTTFEVEDGTRLVLALERNGVDILHKCGGWAKCTTCRVTFESGEPAESTAAETELAENRDLGSDRLSCQLLAAGDMTLTAAMTLSTSDFDDAGDEPADAITPES
jgi:ferredoxin